MKCAHCAEPIRKRDRAGVCPIHGEPGIPLTRGIERCIVCARCYRAMTAEALRDPIQDTRALDRAIAKRNADSWRAK